MRTRWTSESRLLGKCACGAGGLCFAKPVGLATTARAGPAGTPLPAQRPLVGYGLRPARDRTTDSPGEACPPSRLPCRGGVIFKTVMRSRRRSDHTVTVGLRIARTVSVVNRLALRGIDIRLCPTREFVVAPQSKCARRAFALRCHDVMCGCGWRMCTPRRVSRRAAEVPCAINSRAVTV